MACHLFSARPLSKPMLSIRSQGTYFSKILFKIQRFSFKKMHLNIVCELVAILSWPPSVDYSQPWKHAAICHNLTTSIGPGVGVTKPISPVPLFSQIFCIIKNMLTVKYRVSIWQVSPQLSCGDTCQIWMWFQESNMYFCEIENFAYGEINERSFSNPHPRTVMVVAHYGREPDQFPYSHSGKTSYRQILWSLEAAR